MEPIASNIANANELSILKDLNEDQRKPAMHVDGPCFIVAGPGSGKTKTIVSRTNYMIKYAHVPPERQMLFTFTNKAANELKQRVIAAIGDEGKKLTVGTYHSICVMILKQFAESIGYSNNFVIYDSDDSNSLLKRLTKGTEFDHMKAGNYIGSCKDKLINPQRAMENAKNNYEMQLAEIYNLYQKELFQQGAMDFDDLIVNTIRLLENNYDILERLNKRYQYITADEFHDSSPRDIRLMELLAGETKNICMILDDEQSIYSFRGADIEAVLNIDKIFPNLKKYVLRQNYRSTKTIVSAARSLIAKNKNQLEKTIFTNNEEGTPVIYFEDSDQKNEALRVLKLVMLATNKYNVKYKDIAILYRMSYLSRAIEDAFLQGSVPYKITGGTPFYARKEIKDILSYARLLSNPMDFEAFKRVINTPKRGIGDTSIEKIFDYARTHYSHPIDFLRASKEIVTAIDKNKKNILTGKSKSGLIQFNQLMDELDEIMENNRVVDLIMDIIEKTEYRAMVYDEEKQITKAEDRLANLVELCEIASTFDNVEELLRSCSLDSSIDEEGNIDDNQVQMMTMHASKGLEFPVVIIVGANEGISPHWKAFKEKELEEERRLFYVAMTRAEKYLFITRSKTVIQNGVPTQQSASRFIREINKQYIQKY